ncbi:hypothetical protein EVG20_g1553 [Dentipellis fragilis]|uniref:DUF1740-domain-containing protein n=1 Tax=Dentipellis fragilis TaxID=205917 RepID=A0A4Y9ZBT9_9AGAM|nr:hypothetical protein EVG20_g1553 [Dentipellis fragilis]
MENGTNPADAEIPRVLNEITSAFAFDTPKTPQQRAHSSMDAPSFSSFAPSFSSFPDFEQGSSKHVPPSKSSEHPEDNADEKRRKHRSSKKEKDKKRKKARNKGGEVDDEKSRGNARRDAVPFNDDRESRPYALDDRQSRPVFYTDRKGDPLNVRFGGLYAKEVPKYQLVAWGRKILGLDGSWTVVHRGGGGLEVGIGGRRKTPSITDSSSRVLLNAPPTRRLIPSSADASRYQESDGFIKLPSAKDRHGDQSYRSIERSKDDADSDFDSSSATSGLDLSEEDEIEGLTLTSFQEKTRSLEQRLTADPTSTSNWLSLLSHSLSQIPSTSRSSTKTRADITHSIVSRALTSLPKNVPAHKLRLIYLQAGEEIWEAPKLRDEWEKALKEGNADVKMAWLDWRTRMGGRALDDVLDDALRTLQLSTSELERLRIFWRTAVTLRQAGYIERAMAMFQVQAELIFNMPSPILRSSFEEQLDALEEYWESEAPRIGESGGNGWAAWVAAGKPEHFADAAHPSQESLSNTADPYTSWACQEVQSDRMLQPPSRSTEPAADEDPFSTVLFSDVRPFLSTFLSVRGKSGFRLVWLSFLGLHVPGLETLLSSSETTDDRWCEIHLSSTPYLASIYPPAPEQRRITGSSYAGVLIGQQEEYASGFGPVKTWGYRAVGPMDVFGDTNWGMWTREDVQGVNVEFIRRVFERCQLDTKGDDAEWDVLNLTFEAVLSVKGALKVSRGLLANARESVAHWSAHARLERLRGRLDDARKIYRTVTSTPSSSENKLSLGPLWYDWADMEWLDGQSDAAIQVIFRAAGLDATTGLGVAILRAKRILDDTARTIPGTLWKVQESWLRLAALLELLTSASSADCPAFLSAPIKQGSIADESAAVSSLTMLYHHVLTLRGAAKPTVLRERLDQALVVYPNNTAILGMFLEAQKGQGVWGRVRELLEVGTEDSGEQPKNVARRVADVWVAGWEKGRWDWEIERTRGGLAAAVESERTRGSPILWRLYIELEIRAGQLRRAKDLLFRALGQCPFVKELYLLAFDALRSVFTARELNALAESMAERGLRMRKGLDDAVAGWTEDKEEEESSGEEDEIEADAREQQRLRPY